MKREHKAVVLSLFIAFLLWVVDAVINYLFFYKRSFMDLLIFNIPLHELYMRTTMTVGFLTLGIIIAWVLGRRRRIEDALRESEERYHAIFEQAPDSIVLIDAETGELVEFNRRAHEDLGYTREEFKKLRIPDFEVIESAEEVANHRKKIIREGADTFETKHRRNNGEIRDILMSCRAISIADRDFIQAIWSDITERKKAEEERRLQNEIAANMSEGVYLIRADNCVILYTNPRFEEMFGYGPGEMIGKHVSIVNAPAEMTPDETVDHIVGILKQTGVWQGEILNIKKDGTPFWCFASTSMFEHPEYGEIIVSVHTDITERKKAEEEIGYLAKFPAENLNPVLRIAKDGTVLYANDASRALFKDFDAKVLREPLDQFILNALSSGAKVESEITCGNRIFSLTFAPIPGADYGNIYGMDITGRRNVEEQLRHAQKLEAMGTLAGGLAHDFNNILAGIMGYTSLLKHMFSKNSPSMADLESIDKLSQRGADLTQALLSFARRGNYQPRSLNINRVVNEVIGVVKRVAGKSIVIKTELSPEVSHVFGGEGQLNQVFMNLCLNACDAMPTGGTLTVTSADIELSSEFFGAHPNLQDVLYVAVRVADTGVGIDAGTLEHIFEPFFTTKPAKAGTGLGLSIVNGIVESHGGCIHVESSPEKGSTFTVYLPATVEQIGEKRVEARGVPVGDETIMIVDDEEDFRMSVGRWLTDLGYSTVMASSGEEALKLLTEKKSAVDLVLLDMIMVGIDGERVFNGLREIVPDLPVIICTGYSLVGAARRVLDAGANDFIQKPFGLTKLAFKLRKVLDNR